MVHLVGGTGVYIECDAEIFKGLFIDVVVAIDNSLGGDSFVPGFQGDGYSVLIRSADRDYIPVAPAKVSYVNIGGDIDTGQVTQMDGAIGIG